MLNTNYEFRSRHRESWLQALSVFRARASDLDTLPPPEDDVTMVGFADDLLWAAANIVGGPALSLYPMHNGERVVLKRVWKQQTAEGGPNPNYGRFYCVSKDGSRYFQWLTETLWWKSLVVQDVLCPVLLQWYGQQCWSPHEDRSKMYCEAFHHLYTMELPVNECARTQIPANEPSTPQAQVQGTPTQPRPLQANRKKQYGGQP